MKREKRGNSPGETGRVGAANGIVTVILPCVWKCVCAHVRTGRSRVCLYVCMCVWEYCRDQFTVVRVRCLSSEAFILGMFVLV